jgi:(hydroxyamino)benzene mutase
MAPPSSLHTRRISDLSKKWAFPNRAEGERGMSDSSRSLRQSQRLLQIGILLLLYSSFEGFAIPYLASQRVGLSVHTLSALQGVLMLALGLVWPRLRLGARSLRVAFWCSIYGALSILAAYTISAIWGVGNGTLRLVGELPHGLSHGTAFQETSIAVLSYSSAPAGLASLALILLGLRNANDSLQNP